ncbi:MAG: bifunctional metallophosphatase/5'-nucleotidase [Rhodobacteraceae bacterium]|nr:bifunctional metallophosphatase/5'-nucleotidase [Paracoccaceae bacterium]
MRKNPSQTRMKDRLRRGSLRVLATTDLHMNLRGYDYLSDQPNPTIGLTRIATLVKQARAEARANGTTCLLVDNGDGLQGTPLENLAHHDHDQPHPLMRAFGMLNYDAIGLGNHDFNFGLDALRQTLETAPCPVVCSNLECQAGAIALPTRPTVLLHRTIQCDDGVDRPLRIGILSLVPPQTVTWDSHLLTGNIRVRPFLESARDAVADLKAKRADVIVALAHTGFGAMEALKDQENALHPLTKLEGLDAIVGGHTHLPYPLSEANTGADAGCPTVLPGAAGSHLGVVDLELLWFETGGWRVGQSTAALRAVATIGGAPSYAAETPEDAKLVELLQPLHDKVRQRIAEPLGHTDVALHSYFSLFSTNHGSALVAAAQTDAVRRLLNGQPEAELPILSAVAPGKSGGRSGPLNFTEIWEGPLRLRDVASLHAYPDLLRAVLVDGRTLIEWLEMSASVFNQILPGSHNMPLQNDDRPGHNFDVLFGLDYRIDLSAPARFTACGQVVAPENRRIRDLTWRGQPVEQEQKFIVATNSYRVSGGGSFKALETAIQLAIKPIQISDLVRNYITERPKIARGDLLPNPWRFTHLPQTTVLLQTGPGAQRYLQDMVDQDVRMLEINKDGFLELELSL